MTVTRGVSPRDFTEWTRGMLVFNKAALRDVVAELSRAYDVPIQVNDSTLRQASMTMEVAVTQQSVTEILEIIGQLADAHYVKRGTAYVLLPGPGKATTPSQAPLHAPHRQTLPQPEKDYGK